MVHAVTRPRCSSIPRARCATPRLASCRPRPWRRTWPASRPDPPTPGFCGGPLAGDIPGLRVFVGARSRAMLSRHAPKSIARRRAPTKRVVSGRLADCRFAVGPGAGAQSRGRHSSVRHAMLKPALFLAAALLPSLALAQEPPGGGTPIAPTFDVQAARTRIDAGLDKDYP